MAATKETVLLVVASVNGLAATIRGYMNQDPNVTVDRYRDLDTVTNGMINFLIEVENLLPSEEDVEDVEDVDEVKV